MLQSLSCCGKDDSLVLLFTFPCTQPLLLQEQRYTSPLKNVFEKVAFHDLILENLIIKEMEEKKGKKIKGVGKLE